jgi:hypothetical protein
MLELISPSSFLESFFWFCALLGSFLFIIKSLLLLSAVSIDFSESLETDESDSFFKIFSIHSFSGFLMIFGWTGLAFFKQFHFPRIHSFLLAFLLGCLMLLIVYYLFKGARQLISRGSLFSVDQTIGKTGIVYHRIPVDGIGKIQVVIDGFLHEIYATTYPGQEIPSFSQVHVLAVVDNSCVLVEPLP